MASFPGDTPPPTREELLACLIPALQSLPLLETESGPEIDIESVAQTIIDHLRNSGYAINRKP